MNYALSFLSAHWAMIAAFLMIVAASGSTLVLGNINQVKIGVPQNNRWMPCPSGVTSGMAVLIGTMAAVAMDDYDASTGGTTFLLDGDYALTVIGHSQMSPVANVQINPGDEIYASGTHDTTTGITYSLTLDGTVGNCPFGNYMGITPILQGVTNTSAVVRLKIGGSPGVYGK